MNPAPVLYLVPSTLGGEASHVITPWVLEAITPIQHFIVEELRTARRGMRAMGYTAPFDDVHFSVLNEHTADSEVHALLQPLRDGRSIALLSEAGVPCVADPGAAVVRKAHEAGFRVVPLSGPSSILLTLVGSGLNGQSFAFTGYLPRDRSDRVRRIRQLEQLAISQHQTQLFMDAPYRNDQVMEDLVATLHPSTLLCVAADLTCPSEFLRTRTAKQWKDQLPKLHKRPVMFAIGS